MNSVPDYNSIDWNALWNEGLTGRRQERFSSQEHWDRRAADFNKQMESPEKKGKDGYISRMLDRIEVKPDWSVLDIGCGPGTLTIPLALKAKSVTALDISPQMLRYLRENAETAGLENIRYIQAAWQEALLAKTLDAHDVVVASRSMMAGDMREALSSINQIAGQAVYLTFPVVRHPLDAEISLAVGRNRALHPPYIFIYNLLFQMGITANVEILSSIVRSRYSDINQVIEQLQQRTDPFTEDEKSRAREFLQEKFAGQSGAGGYVCEGASKWALIWWKKDR
jgi:SAM-dependent methyltransferase